VEVVDLALRGFSGLNDAMFQKFKRDTAKAGRGECLGYEVIEPEISEAARERGAVALLFDRAERLRSGSGDNDYADSFRVATQAREAFATWQAKYPAEAAAEAKANRLAAAKGKAARDERFRTSFIGRGID
jgi:hypothetical protein